MDNETEQCRPWIFSVLSLHTFSQSFVNDFIWLKADIRHHIALQDDLTIESQHMKDSFEKSLLQYSEDGDYIYIYSGYLKHSSYLATFGDF